MNVETLEALYIAELQEARSVEAQLAATMPRVAQAAKDETLKQALDEHHRETRDQLEKVDAILQRHGAEVREHRDQSMQTIIAEAEKWASMIDNQACRDAALIASAQRIEHYEIAVYGSLAAWANQLGFEQDQKALAAILEEEKTADNILSDLAKRNVNPKAG